jgi:hypothetical protein
MSSRTLSTISGYTDAITIVLKFCQGLHLTTQDRIAKSGMDRLGNMDFNGWFKTAQCLDLHRLANVAFHLASRRPPTHSAPSLMTYFTPPCTPFSLLHLYAPPTAMTPAAMHTPSCALPPGVLMDVDRTQTLQPIVQTCYRCSQTGHISRECHLCHDVCHMT